MEGSGAEFGPVGVVALVDGGERRIGGFHDVIAAGHGFGVVGAGADEGIAGSCADAELQGGGFVVGEIEAAADAGAIDGVMNELDAPVAGSVQHGDDAGAVGKRGDEALGIGCEAVEVGGVAVEEDKEHGSANGKSERAGFARLEGSKDAETKNGGNGGEARDNQPNPAGVDVGVNVLGEKECRGERDEIEFEREDRKSTRLNSSHMSISYAVFCLKKKKDRGEASAR